MKKILFFVILCLISICSFAQDFEMKQIAKFENKREQGFLFLRKNSEVSDSEFDITGNGIKFDENGNFYFIQSDMHKIYTYEIKNKKLSFIKDIDFLETGSEGISKISDNYYFCSGSYGRFKLLDKDFNFKFKIQMLDWNMRIDTAESYYDESADILFFRDTNQAMHCIVHPGMNDAENRKNYKNPGQTIEYLASNSDNATSHLGLYKGKYLTVDGQVYYWAGTTINHINYQIYDNKEVDIWNDDELEIQCTSQNEEIESIAIHPCGDIYVLRMNWQTNTHNLYYIENTWDPEWREQWYKEHPDAVRP